MTLRSIFYLREAQHREQAVHVQNWFWGAAASLAGIRHLKNAAATPKVPKSPKRDKRKDDKAAHGILHKSTHPLLAESCARVLGKKKMTGKECISSTTNTANLAKSKESKLKFHAVKFLEAAKAVALPNTFRVVLLEEGLGNLNDVYYYTREALESAAPVFDGLKIFADHPSLEEEEIRPERSTRDILGHYENVSVQDGDEGRAWLCGDLSIMPSVDCEWARDLMIRAVENAKKFPDKPFIGLSINAGGEATKTPIDDVIKIAPDGAKEKLNEAKDNGIDLVKVVNAITRGTSCDLVTEAGAGGKILNIIGDENDGEEKAG